MLIIAHRGANREALENSWSAFHAALKIGCQRIELDLQLSADNQIFVLHDDELEGMTGKSGKISQLSQAELVHLTLRNGERIPTLREIIEKLLPNIELNLEIKGDRPELAEAAAKIVALSPHRHKVIFSSFYLQPLNYLQIHFPNFRQAVLWGYDTKEIDLSFYFAPQLMMDGRTLIHPQVDLVTDEFVGQANARGWEVYPWVPMAGEKKMDRVKLWEKLADLGIPGLCTNYPREMKQWFAARAQQAKGNF